MSYKDIEFKPVKTNFGITIVDRNDVKHYFSEETHGSGWMHFAKMFQATEEHKMAVDFWAEREKERQEGLFWNRLRKRLGMEFKYK